MQLDASLHSARKRVGKKAATVSVQQAKVAESVANGHGTRLAQRQSKLQGKLAELRTAPKV